MARELSKDKRGIGEPGMIFLIKIVYDATKKFKKSLKELAEIHNWHGTEQSYVYHIHDDLRPGIARYLPSNPREYTKRVGFIFGNDDYMNTRRTYDIGIYGFLPLHKLLNRRGASKIGNKNVEELCIYFAKRGYKDKIVDREVRVVGQKLMRFLFSNICINKQFPKMMMSPKNSPFAKAYRELWEKCNGDKKVMKGFVRASFRGMYINSSKLRRVGLTHGFSELVHKLQIEKMTKAEIEIEAKKKAAELKGKSIKEITEIATIEANGREIIIPSIIILSKQARNNLKNLIQIFDRELYNFEVKKGLIERGDYNRRVPIIVDVFKKGKRKTLSSLCAGFNEETGHLEQVRYWGVTSMKNPKRRFEELIRNFKISAD